MTTLARTTATPVVTPSVPMAVPASSPLPAALRLQRAVGNYAVGQLLQAKLELGSPHDPAEHEADGRADAVVNEAPSKACECGTPGAGECEKCRANRNVVHHSLASASTATGPAPPSVHAALAGSGRRLPATVAGS